MRFTIFGGYGFIGRHLQEYLKKKGYQVVAPIRGAESDLVSSGEHLGNVIYAIGLTSDFRERPIETVDAHVNKLAELLYSSEFSSWLYLSSTRLYSSFAEADVVSEDINIPVKPSADSLYNLSKLLGESICLSSRKNNIRIARLSNVFGGGQNKSTFLGMLIEELRLKGSVKVKEAPGSKKDYIYVNDVCQILTKIALGGRHRIYNVASGISISHKDLAKILEELTSGVVEFEKGGPERSFPGINISRIKNEFGFQRRPLDENLLRSL